MSPAATSAARPLAPTERRARIIPDLSAAAYHADPCATPSLSASCATTLANRTPYHAWLEHPRLGGVARESSATMDRGSLMHALVLEDGAGVVVVDAPDWRTKAAREARDEAHAAGAVPVLAADYVDARAVAAAVLAQLAEHDIELVGDSEVSLEWTEDGAEGPVLCRGRLDHLVLGRTRATILDLKTTRSASPRDCARSTLDHGYDVQRAAYVSAVEALRPDVAGRVDFKFVFVEELPPGAPRRALVTVARLDGMFRERGARRWRRATETWARCLATNEWPGYAPGLVALECPAWALMEDGL